MFLLLNIISGFLETGGIIFALRHFGTEAALVSALLYQMGNLVPHPVRISKSTALLFSALSGILMTAGIFIPIYGIIAVPFLSAAIQSFRSGMKTDSRKMLKRSLRMAGFLMGFCFQPMFGIIFSTVTLYGINRYAAIGKTKIAFPTLGKLQIIMIFHQLHYFAYCYAVMIIAYQFGGALLAASLFFAGWGAYVFAPVLYGNGRNYRQMFIFGHSLLTAILLCLFFMPSLSVKALIWLLTGFGGTTEFCLGRLEKEQCLYSELNHGCAENFGHILGVITCLASFVLTGNLYLSVLLSAVYTSCATILMLSSKRGAKV